MRYLNPSDIRQALSYEEMMTAVEEAFLLFAQGRCAMADRSALTQGTTTLPTMPCFAGGYAATKLLASCPDNPRRGLPSLYGTVLLSQGDTGQPVACWRGTPSPPCAPGPSAAWPPSTWPGRMPPPPAWWAVGFRGSIS